MDLTSSTMWFAIALLFITTIVVTKEVRRRNMGAGPMSTRPAPPVVDVVSLVGFLRVLRSKGLRGAIDYQQTKLGSVFTVSLLVRKVTFLVGPEVSAHFYRGPESEISPGDLNKFTVPMFGKGVGYDIDDLAIRNEQIRFFTDALKPLKVRTYVAQMVDEVKDYFARWGQHGTVDLKYEMVQVLMLIASRCLMGKEVREKMLDEVCALLRDLDNGLHLISIFFPYLPISAHRKRDKARARLTKIFSEIVRSRKSSGRAEEDVLQSMIDSKYNDGHPTTETEITGLLLGVLFAGKHTSSNTSTWTGAFLLTHSKFLAATIEEQKKIIRQHGDHIDYDVLLEMDTLHRCIKEALRIQPPILMLRRQAHSCFTVRTRQGNEYDVPKGHTIASPVIFNNYYSYIYKDPHVFDPDRFHPGREEDKVAGPFSYTSFGAGRHGCAGECYAYVQIKVIWSYLLRNFELKLISPFPKVDWSKLFLEPKGQVMVSYTRRQLPSA